jgi:hypothetical protein
VEYARGLLDLTSGGHVTKEFHDTELILPEFKLEQAHGLSKGPKMLVATMASNVS